MGGLFAFNDGVRDHPIAAPGRGRPRGRPFVVPAPSGSVDGLADRTRPLVIAGHARDPGPRAAAEPLPRHFRLPTRAARLPAGGRPDGVRALPRFSVARRCIRRSSGPIGSSDELRGASSSNEVRGASVDLASSGSRRSMTCFRRVGDVGACARTPLPRRHAPTRLTERVPLIAMGARRAHEVAPAPCLPGVGWVSRIGLRRTPARLRSRCGIDQT